MSLRDHVELAERTGGALIPVGSAAHMPFVDHGEEVDPVAEATASVRARTDEHRLTSRSVSRARWF